MTLKRLICGFFIPLFFASSVFASQNFDERLAQLDKLLQTDLPQAEMVFTELAPSVSQFTRPQLATYHTLSSIKHLYLSELEQAHHSLDIALSFEPSEELLTRIYLYKVTIYLMQRNYEAAFSMLEMNLSRIESYQDNRLKVASYVRLLNILLDLNAYDEMRDTANLVLDINQGQDTKNECYAKLYLAVATLKLTQYPLANDLFKDSQIYCAANEQPLIANMSIKGQAQSYFELGQLVQARPMFETALAGYETFRFQLEINEVKAYLSKIYFYQKDYDRAAEYAQELSKLNDDKVNQFAKKQANEVLAMLASKDGDYAKAYQYQLIAHTLDLQYLDDKTNKQNAYQMARFNNAETKRENKSLQQERMLMMQQKDLMLKEKSSSMMFSTLLFGVCIGLVLLLLTAWLQRNQFRRQAQRDGLTGIYNRQTGLDLAEDELVQVLTNKSHFSVMILDLDFFKSINDRFGHATGDWTIKKVAHVIQDIIRPTDIFCRMGGEEFVLYLPNTELSAALILAESIRSEIDNINTKYSGHNFSITISIGLSTLEEGDLSLDPLLSRADIALYESKRQGRNKALIYQPSFA
ncbi:GGDEF domain-containing protein [Shewanella subflava]|uniref:diguanylate cyclase n=1 Tax=Shewanella subflava TaxID=2986476 RepID=A0ABT3I549_9GAMM|nr:GGDEF domain-containing protein [Shewanella subflava]MCW3171196.1 diguanylate cyclase [Shewanella subflava]